MTLSISFDSSVSLYGTIFALGQTLINTRKKERSEQKNKRPQINRKYVEVLFGTMRGLDSTRLNWFERPRFRIRCDVALRWIRATRACSVDCEAALCRDSCLFFQFHHNTLFRLFWFYFPIEHHCLCVLFHFSSSLSFALTHILYIYYYRQPISFFALIFSSSPLSSIYCNIII